MFIISLKFLLLYNSR